MKSHIRGYPAKNRIRCVPRSIGQRGFQVIEAVVAALIIAIGVIPVFDMIGQANRSLASVEEETVAFGLATEAGEWIKALSYKDLQYAEHFIKIFPEDSIQQKKDYYYFEEDPVQSFESGGENKTRIDYEPEDQFSKYKRRIEITKDKGGTGVKVQIQVTWKSRMEKSSEGQKNEVKLQFFRFPLR